MQERVVVAASGLTKRFGREVAVDGIDVAVRAGEAFGFLGPNGAGKTSAMRMIGATSPRDGGSLEVLGLDPATSGPAVRARLGIVPQADNLDAELTVLENVVAYGRFFGLTTRHLHEVARELLGFVELWQRRDARVQTLSGGMKRRLVIARALVNDPDLVLLDEPTTGLDPQARQLLWDRLHRLKQRGVTLVLTTHYMDEAEQLCDRLVVMDRGRIVAEGSPRALIEAHVPAAVVELRFAGGTPDDLAGLDRQVDRAEVLADRVLLYTDDADATGRAVAGSGLAVQQVLTRRSTLEDVFLALSGRTLDG